MYGMQPLLSLRRAPSLVISVVIRTSPTLTSAPSARTTSTTRCVRRGVFSWAMLTLVCKVVGVCFNYLKQHLLTLFPLGNCKCSKTAPKTAAAESGCSYTCSADSKQGCGGYSAISAYNANTAATATVSDTSGIPKSNVTYPGYLGCWNENNGALILPATVLQTNTMTIDQCVATCKAGNYKVRTGLFDMLALALTKEIRL